MREPSRRPPLPPGSREASARNHLFQNPSNRRRISRELGKRGGERSEKR